MHEGGLHAHQSAPPGSCPAHRGRGVPAGRAHYVWTELLWLDEWKIARDEHAEIVDAICAGDAARAGSLARAHVRGSRDNVLRLLQTKSDYRNFLAEAS
ncbi:FCD domain-containing protein [Mesorhizobium sp.]|uniref:FCD domain-containing protein n=1 Tax=Mesorhizobium sp. TaxID=1871066 RepID=UPI0025C36071|nr:FCD domain-containing protein [Mesorhizobium sp.]